MKRVFPSALGALILTLFSVATLRADPQDCLSAPTRACTFDLAVEVAEDDAPRDWARGMRRVAVLQESVGFERSEATLADFIAAIPVRLPDPRDIVGAFYYLPSASLRKGLPKAPRAAEAIAGLLLDQVDRLEGTARDGAVRTAAAYFAYSADRHRIVEMTRAAAPALRSQIVFAATRGLNACGHTAMLLELFDLIEGRRARGDAKGLAVALLARNGDFANAERLIATIEASDERRDAWIAVMQSRYEDQQFDEVRRIARYLEETWPLDGMNGVRSSLETIYARLGDEAKLSVLLRGRQTENTGLDRRYLISLARMVNGDLGPIMTYLEWIQREEHPSWKIPDHRENIRAYLGSGQTDLTPFLAHYSKSHLNDPSA